MAPGGGVQPRLATIAEKYIRKGSKVYIEGQLATRKWQDAEKKDRYATEIVLKSYGGAIELLDRKPSETPEAVTDSDETPASGYGEATIGRRHSVLTTALSSPAGALLARRHHRPAFPNCMTRIAFAGSTAAAADASADAAA